MKENNSRFTNEQIRDIIDRYNNGECVDILRRKYHCRNTTISNVLKSNNIVIKRTYEYYNSKELATQRKYYCDEDIFENIDNSDKAYWLGFIFADGNVYAPQGNSGGHKGTRIEITVKEEDSYHLQNFVSFIKSNYPVKKKVVKLKGKEFIAYRVSIGSVKMGNDLVSHGCTQRKSLTLQYPKNINNKYFGSFLRGYFDGDGCVFYKSYQRGNTNKFSNVVSILGTFEFLSAINSKLKENGIKTRRGVAPTSSKAFVLEISTSSYSDFYNLIYGDGNYMLERKLNKFKELLAHYNKKYWLSFITKSAELLK